MGGGELGVEGGWGGGGEGGGGPAGCAQTLRANSDRMQTAPALPSRVA